MISVPKIFSLIPACTPSLVATRHRDEEVHPRELGLTEDIVEGIWQRVLSLYKTRTHPALGICLRRRGQIALYGHVGHSHGNHPGGRGVKRRADDKTLFNLFSASKAITAMLIHSLVEDRVFHLDDALSQYLPEFRGQRKETITIRQLLNHRAGIPMLPVDEESLDLLSNQREIVRRLCQASPTFRPGKTLSYHALSAGFLLAEAVERTTGRSLREELRARILEPLELEYLNYGVDAETAPLVAENAVTGFPAPWPMTRVIKRALGVGINEAIEAANDARYLTAVVPSGNVVGRTEELCRFYQCLLDRGRYKDKQVFTESTVRRALSEQSYLEFDRTLMLPMRYSLGFMLGGDFVSFFGKQSSHAFGHIGLTNVVGYADPERDIAVALMSTGKGFFHHGIWSWLQIMYGIAASVPTDGRVY